MSKTYRTNNKLTSFPYPSVPRSPVLSDRNHYNNNFESQRLHTYTAPYSNLTVSSPQKNDYSLGPTTRPNTKPSQTKALYTLPSPTKNPGLPSFSSYQLNSIASRRETPAVTKPVDKIQKHALKPRLQLNLGEIDIGIEEFPDGPITVDQKKMINSHTPLESPKIKTLRGINEGFGVNVLYSVRSVTNRTKKIMFPSETGFDKENSKKDPYANDYMFYGSKSSIMEDSSQKYKEVFLDEKILKTVSGFLNCRDIVYFKSVLYEFRHEKKYAKIFKKRMYELMAVGLNDKDQYYFWDSLIHFRRVRDLYPSTFTAQFVKDCPYMKDILKDLDRTLPEYEKYSTMEGKEALLKVLVALANTIKDIGYIQGLNAIAGVFLFYLNEEKSYWITLYMMEKVKMKNILREDFNKVHVLNYQLKTFLENYIPDVATYLNQRGVDISDYTTCWFITLFSYFLTLQNTIKAWNFLFINGNSFLIQLGLAVFSRYKDKILNMDVDNLGSFFKYDLQEISANDNMLFEEAVRFHVSNRLMNDLEAYYNKGKPQLKLIKDFYNKYQWRPLDENVSFKNITARRPKFHLDLSSHKDIKSNQSSETRRLGSPTSALEKGKDFVQNIVQTITIDLPEALKGIFVKSPTTTDRATTTDRHRNISIAENILIPSQVSQPSTLTSLQVGSRALQDIDSNYDLKPMEKPKPVMNSMELVLNKENKRKKCRSEKKQKKEPSIRVVNLTSATVETEDNESILQPATAEKVRPSKEVALVEMKNRLMNKKRMNIGNIGATNYTTKSRLNVENIQLPKTEEGFFSPRFHSRHNH